jgi:hypothetical protein
MFLTLSTHSISHNVRSLLRSTEDLICVVSLSKLNVKSFVFILRQRAVKFSEFFDLLSSPAIIHFIQI